MLDVCAFWFTILEGGGVSRAVFEMRRATSYFRGREDIAPFSFFLCVGKLSSYIMRLKRLSWLCGRVPTTVAIGRGEGGGGGFGQCNICAVFQFLAYR